MATGMQNPQIFMPWTHCSSVSNQHPILVRTTVCSENPRTANSLCSSLKSLLCRFPVPIMSGMMNDTLHSMPLSILWTHLPDNPRQSGWLFWIVHHLQSIFYCHSYKASCCLYGLLKILLETIFKASRTDPILSSLMQESYKFIHVSCLEWVLITVKSSV